MEQSEKGVNREKTGRTGDKKGWNRVKKRVGLRKKVGSERIKVE